MAVFTERRIDTGNGLQKRGVLFDGEGDALGITIRTCTPHCISESCVTYFLAWESLAILVVVFAYIDEAFALELGHANTTLIRQLH